MSTSEAHLETTESTMDAARALAAGQDFILVSARTQTRGKGTRGRAWNPAPGNVYMTVGVHRRHLPADRMALFPLELGVHVIEECRARAAGPWRGRLRLKWPNDLMLSGAKAGGILIESHGDMLLAGIGLNLAAAPEVNDGGTPSACLSDAGIPAKDREDLIAGIYRRIREAPGGPSYQGEAVLVAWQAKVDWARPLRLRDRPGNPVVQTVSVNRQGHLLVRHADGREEWLVSEYLI